MTFTIYEMPVKASYTDLENGLSSHHKRLMNQRQLEIAADAEHRTKVGDRLILARESLGLGQGAFAARYGISQSRLANWEAGTSYPRPLFLVRICEDTGLTIDWFYRGTLSGVTFDLAQRLRRQAEAL